MISIKSQWNNIKKVILKHNSKINEKYSRIYNEMY